MIRSALSGSLVAFATMHGKELLAREPFREILGADVVAAPDLDTDQFGTFTGEIARSFSPRVAARTKARLGIQLVGTPYGLASEGSFTSGIGLLVEHHEVLIFVDEALGLEVVEGAITTSPLPSGRVVTSLAEGLGYAKSVGFPEQGVILRASSANEIAQKSLGTFDALSTALDDSFRTSGEATISPDYRAHRCPSRAEVIADLAHTMARRLATPCPHCDAPGFGQVDIERGLRCADCGQSTRVVSADIYGCGLCPHTVRSPRPDHRASPHWCDYCNP